MRTLNRSKTISGLFASAALIGTLLGPATAHAEPQGYIQDVFGVGLVYGTFEEGPDLTLLVGGTVEEFCLANPEDPFNAEPGVAPMRVFFRNSGTVDLKVNDKDQPIYLYDQTEGGGPEWIGDTCADLFDGDPDTIVPAPFASGTADLKVRVSIISDDLVDVFNSVNGELVASDGTEYRVRASADVIVGPFGPEGDPEDFVSFELKEIGR